MSFVFRAHLRSLCTIFAYSSILILSNCNSKQERTTKPQTEWDPETPALFVPSDHSEEERQRILDKATAELKKSEQEADAELERISKEKQQREQARLLRLEEERKVTAAEARKKFKGTRFDTLRLTNGDSFNHVTVMDANDIGITISYEHGARRIKYHDLPYAIQERCHYHEESLKTALSEELKQRQIDKAADQRKISARTKSKTTSRSTHTQSNTPTTTPAPKNETPPTARGHLSVTVKRTYSRYISGIGKVHFKQLRVRSSANVSAILYNNGRYIASIQPGEKAEHILESGYHGKYELMLKDTKGKVLDKEAHNMKSGLGGARL